MDRPIRIIGARSHNLRNISVSIPRNKIVVVTGAPPASLKSKTPISIT